MEATGAQARILVVEDDENILEAIAYNLKRHGYACLTALTGLEGLRKVRQEKPDLAIIDLMLPVMDGWKLTEQLRQEGFELPIIICSARTSEFDKVHGLSLGADDYLTKPFGMSELMARVEANLRRAVRAAVASVGTEVIAAGPLEIDPVKKEVLIEGEALDLTPKEFAVLHYLASRSPQALSREEIYAAAWGYEMMHGDRSVDVFIRRIRKKLARRVVDLTFLHTHYGFGYKFKLTAPEQQAAPE